MNVHLRRATLDDAARLAALDARAGQSGTEEVMTDWIEHGGAFYYEDETGEALSSLLWREVDGGWLLQQLATAPEARGMGYGRWLMTQVEALAIRHNVPELCLELGEDDERLNYYRRMGYEPREGTDLLCKKVGGTWQIHESRRP